MNEWNDTPDESPDKASFVPHAGDLDALYAWEHFGGLTRAAAFAKFCESPEYYQEDFMFMGGPAFAYHYPVIERYVLESKVESCSASQAEIPGDGDVEAIGILAHCIKAHFDIKEIASVEHLRPRILDLAKHVRGNLAQYCADPEEQQRVDAAWQELESCLHAGPPSEMTVTPLTPRRRWLFGLLALVVIVGASIALLGIRKFVPATLGAPEHFSAAGYNVARMAFNSYEDETKKIPPERIPLVLAALTEGTVDNDPAKWVVLGNLRCEMQSGDVLDISLFTIDDSELAFRTDAEPYFRGLNATRLATAIGE